MKIKEDQFGIFIEIAIGDHTLVFRNIKSGSFVMGSPEDEIGREENEKQHLVDVGEFWMSDTTCTQYLYQMICGNNPSTFVDPQHPVEFVKIADCFTFIYKFNNFLKCTGYQIQVALPTEEQWEYACRAGTTTPYSFGVSLYTYLANFGYCKHITRLDIPDKDTCEVTSYDPNTWGLYNMHGNVWEWCSTSMLVPSTGLEEYVIRGGSWLSPVLSCRAARRMFVPANCAHSSIGFRLIAEVV